MKKLFQFFSDNILLLFTSFLLVFIPLYPKLPLLDIKYTWVYVRVEDFVVLFVFSIWVVLLIRKKVSLATPLTVPILLFWTIGSLSTIHGIFLIFPALMDAYPNVAFLSFLRRIEYMGLFFIGFEAVKAKRQFRFIFGVLILSILAVSFYGIGQKYFGFPAFLTMNEEFAKGIPIRLSALSRVSSTFSGHYDLAAYLAFTLPIVASMLFAFRHWFVRVVLLITVVLGFIVMVMTVSRISLFALFVSLGIVLFIQRKKLVLISLPIIAGTTFIFIIISPRIVDRFINTVREVEVLVDAKTGNPLGHTKVVPKAYFKEKIVKQQFAQSIADINKVASPSATRILPYSLLEENMVLYVEPNAPTGENLPQGTGYINLTLSPIKKRLGHFYYEPTLKQATSSAEVFVINGDYLLKKVLAYDLSFTTRFQGEWPRAMDAFKRNILFGSGYGSVGLAVDSSYIRMLGEVGIAGLGAFLAIFIMTSIYIKKIWSGVDNHEVRSFIIGFAAGAAGLMINALFIDVFEASKVAFILWLLSGIVLGMLGRYRRASPDLFKQLKKVITSPSAVVVFLFILTFVLYSPMIRNNFVGDDFTWFRWVADCGSSAATSERCNVNSATIVRYFTQANGFFYRPGAKLYFLIMYSVFWLNQSAYHTVSLLLHFGVAVLVFLLARKFFRSLLLATAAGVIFMVFSGHAEPIFWVSATGFLFTAFFSLLSLLSYITWQERNKPFYFVLTLECFVLALLFHELGIVTPFFYLLYTLLTNRMVEVRLRMVSLRSALLFAPLLIYLALRYLAGSHWLSGDYNYNLMKLPFNAVGNAMGYFILTLFGPVSLPLVQMMRSAAKSNLIIATGTITIICLIIMWAWKKQKDSIEKEDRRILFFGTGFFVISLLPFIGLGNITSRYSYLSSIGVVFVLVYILNKLYLYVLDYGRVIAVLSIMLISGTMGLFQLIQHRQLQNDWYEAGEKSRRFIVSMEYAYQDYWAVEPMEFHFVNVPIRLGSAWVYPVGIPDVLWFVFRNPNIRVFTWTSVSQAMDAVDVYSKNQKVFEFTPEGILTEKIKVRTTQ